MTSLGSPGLLQYKQHQQSPGEQGAEMQQQLSMARSYPLAVQGESGEVSRHVSRVFIVAPGNFGVQPNDEEEELLTLLCQHSFTM